MKTETIPSGVTVYFPAVFTPVAIYRWLDSHGVHPDNQWVAPTVENEIELTVWRSY